MFNELIIKISTGANAQRTGMFTQDKTNQALSPGKPSMLFEWMYFKYENQNIYVQVEVDIIYIHIHIYVYIKEIYVHLLV